MISIDSPKKESEGPASRRPANRRDLILDAAIQLFHERGYPTTSVDDIGKAVDVSGPAIYRHFSSKEEILISAIRLAANEVHAINDQARSKSTDPRQILTAYIRAYVDVALDRSALIAVWSSEARHVSHDCRSPIERRLRSWSTEWVDALRSARPKITQSDARLLVSGAIGLITSVATSTDRTTRFSSLADSLTNMALAVLESDPA